MTSVPGLKSLLMRFSVKLACVILSAVSATITEAQVASSPHQTSGHRAMAKPSPVVSAPAPTPVPTTPASLLEEPPTPAKVNLYAGKLTVNAENSTLSGIMRDITAQTGMTVDGLSKDQRIFGNYGPASPREVLSALLNGLDYNIVMVGDQANGAPRRLLLTPRTAAPANGVSAAGPMRQNAQQNNDADDDDDTPQQEIPDNAPPRPDMNPGQEPPAQPGQVKTPQQMLQELQQLRQRQQQQLQQQQSNPQ